MLEPPRIDRVGARLWARAGTSLPEMPVAKAAPPAARSERRVNGTPGMKKSPIERSAASVGLAGPGAKLQNYSKISENSEFRPTDSATKIPQCFVISRNGFVESFNRPCQTDANRTPKWRRGCPLSGARRPPPARAELRLNRNPALEQRWCARLTWLQTEDRAAVSLVFIDPSLRRPDSTQNRRRSGGSEQALRSRPACLNRKPSDRTALSIYWRRARIITRS